MGTLGFLLMGGGLLLIGIAIGYILILVLYAIVQTLFSALGGALCSANQTINNLTEGDEVKTLIKQKQDERNALVLKKEQERQRKENELFNEVTSIVMDLTKKLQLKYPLADKELFDEYRNSYNNVAKENIDALEEKIRQQHVARYNSQYAYRKYTWDDLTTLKPIYHKLVDCVSINIFNDGGNFIVAIYNSETYSKLISTYKSLMNARSVADAIAVEQTRKRTLANKFADSLDEFDMKQTVNNAEKLLVQNTRTSQI